MAGMNALLQKVANLAPIPATVSRLITMLSDNNYEPSELEEIVRQDEALAAAILRLANSAQYGQPGRTFSLEQGIIRIGSSTLLRLALRLQSTDMFLDAGKSFGLRRGSLWQSSIGGACAAEYFAVHPNGTPVDKGLAYVAGLMRDIGKLALDEVIGPMYHTRVTEHANGSRSFIECERLAFDFDHAELGQALAVHWGLPVVLANAIGAHHAPSGHGDDTHSALHDVVHAGDVVALWAGFGVGTDGLQYEVAPHIAATYFSTHDDIETSIAYAVEHVRQAELDTNPMAREEHAA